MTDGQGHGIGTGGSGGQGMGGNGGGGEGIRAGGRDYAYIRDSVMRHVRYPDEARRRGIEGKVLLSFVVLEDGSTARIRVERGSGSRLLDESARRAVAGTRVERRVPYRVAVHLPVTYRLDDAR
jgi:TonB family protein